MGQQETEAAQPGGVDVPQEGAQVVEAQDAGVLEGVGIEAGSDEAGGCVATEEVGEGSGSGEGVGIEDHVDTAVRRGGQRGFGERRQGGRLGGASGDQIRSGCGERGGGLGKAAGAAEMAERWGADEHGIDDEGDGASQDENGGGSQEASEAEVLSAGLERGSVAFGEEGIAFELGEDLGGEDRRGGEARQGADGEGGFLQFGEQTAGSVVVGQSAFDGGTVGRGELAIEVGAEQFGEAGVKVVFRSGHGADTSAWGSEPAGGIVAWSRFGGYRPGLGEALTNRQAGPCQAALDGAHGHVKGGGDVGVIQLLDVPQDDDGAGGGVEFGEGLQGALVRFVQLGLVAGRAGALVHQLAECVGLSSQGLAGVGQARERDRARPAHMVDAEVQGDAEEPGIKPALAAIAPNALQGPDERLLGQFLGVVVVGDHAVDGVEEPMLVLFHQVGKRRHVAPATAFD